MLSDVSTVGDLPKSVAVADVHEMEAVHLDVVDCHAQSSVRELDVFALRVQHFLLKCHDVKDKIIPGSAEPEQ